VNILSKFILIIFSTTFSFNALCLDQTDDEIKVKEAILDYVEGIYLVDESRIKRSVSKTLTKIGYSKRRDATQYQTRNMTYEQLYNLAKTYNKEGRVNPETAMKKIDIYEVTDQTATAKLSASWGMDYMHLAKIEGKWMIVNVMWQSYPQ